MFGVFRRWHTDGTPLDNVPLLVRFLAPSLNDSLVRLEDTTYM